ncbi:Crp/Fnr family transcriptional regulator [Cryobacterium psychrophilum]|uniref:Crp/Fnr family transcriptional regulator n=1 Tax=Cryobacterium psychrophilum TaxID=41988 RepID=A0A4Y8KPS0_9MICO|nr:Crp/Fnr family transcriptional regulator [Cryobacterium psychrophilum]TDW31577.1 CRP-like cAMP-binding protein [Cryobacterium psychrophilum]TFD75195.1 Crp/Fnr family transcriptional regulator [Cryobacterium psychrophilum]
MLWLEVLPENERARIEPSFLRRTFKRGETVLLQGEPSANVYVVDSGHAAVKVSTPHGESLTVTVLGPNSSFGEIAALTEDEIRTSTVVALDALAVRVLPHRVFDELRRRVPAVDTAIAQSLARRLQNLSDRMAEATFETVQRRVGLRLVELADAFAESSTSASLPLTQDDLAGIVGATRPTVNQVIGTLVTAHLVTVGRGHLDIPDVSALRRYLR